MTQLSLKQAVDTLKDIATLALKAGTPIGFFCVLTYSLSIGHFPRDLTIGDGLLFLMVATCFGVVYMFFVICLVSIGICASPISIKPLFNFGVWVANQTPRKKKLVPFHQLAPFHWLSLLLAALGAVMIYELGRKNAVAYWNLPLLSLALYVFYSIFLSSGNKAKKFEAIAGSILDSEDKKNISTMDDPKLMRQVQLACAGVIVLIPLLLGGVSQELLNAAMRVAHVRIEKPIVYVLEPYSSLIAKSTISDKFIAPKDYTCFDKVIVLLNGIGKTTVISYPDGDVTRNLEIPNEKIIVQNQ